MKNKYTRLTCLALLFGSFISQTLFAQTAPVIQWQKLLYGPAKQAPNGDLLIANGNVIRLASDGTQKWAISLATYNADNVLSLANGNVAVLAHDSYYFYKWAIILLDPSGTILSTQPFATYTSPNGGYPQLYLFDMAQASDAGFVVLGNVSYGREGSGTNIYKFDTSGALTKSSSIEVPLPPGYFRPNSSGNRVLTLTDGYLVAGSSFGQGWAAKLNTNLDVVWTERYDFAVTFTDIIPSPFYPQAFIATGISTDRTGTITLVISPTQSSINNTAGMFRPSLQTVTFNNYPYDGSITTYSLVPKIVSSNATSFEVIDGVDQRAGDVRITSFGVANQTRWTKIVGGSAAELVNSAIATQDGGYLLTGLTQSNDGDVQGKTAGNVSGWLVKLVPSSTLQLTQPTYNCGTGIITFNTVGGDGTQIIYSAPGITRSSVTSNTGTVEQGLRNDPKTILITAMQSGQTASYSFDLKAFCSGTIPTPTPPVTPTPPTTSGTLTLTQPTYDCTTGAITFNTTGGDGTPITYTAPGITRSAVTNNFGMVEQGLRNDPKTILITAIQSGYAVSYNFDLKSFCSGTVTPPVTPTPPTTGGTLTLVTPTYNCSTGAFTFNYTGGDGTPVEFQAAGITGWTTNPNQFVDKDSRTANDVKPFTLMARQNGQVVTYTWDLKATCGRSARMAAAEAGQLLELKVNGNPTGNTAIIEIRGVEGQAVQLDLLNASGHRLEQRYIEQAGAVDEQRFDLQRQPSGVLLLRAQSGQQRQTVKLIKQ